jgi:putative phage-type endonuclease
MTTESRQLKVGTPDWLAYRQTGIGASEVGAVLGVNPWRSPADVWLEKVGRAQPFEGNAATYWGNRLEELVAQEYAAQTGRKVRRLNYTLRRGVLIGDLDRLVHADDGTLPAVRNQVRTDRALEVKTARDRSLWADGIPLAYEAQGLTYMHLADSLQVVDFATLFLAERDFQIMPLLRDQAAIEEIVARCEEWWQRHIVGNTPPAPRSEDDCRRLWAQHRPATVCFATPEAEVAMTRLTTAKARIAEAKAEEAEARLVVMAAMQDKEVLKTADGARVLATWKAAKDSQKTDWQAVARAAGASEELIAAHTTTVTGARRFLMK